jgi:hypothetical protein
VFGLVTKKQLELHAEELRRDVERGRRDMEELKLEWLSVYDKFRTLLARWTKRDKKAADDPSGPTNGDEPVAQDPPLPSIRFHSRRQF